jgi:exopolysaccharide production protein ExoZ
VPIGITTFVFVVACAGMRRLNLGQRFFMRKLDSLQAGRAVAVLSVLVFHITGLSVEYQHGCFYGPWTQVLRAGVDVFFVISGVVMVVTTYRKLEQAGTGKRFLIHRVSRIYPPYLFLTAILTIYWVARPDATINSHSGGVDVFSSYTLWPSVKRLPLVQVGWSLSYEMMFYLVFFCIIVCVTKAWFPRALMLWSLGVLAGCAAIALDSSGTLLRMFPRASFLFSPYVLEFVTGCFIGLAFLKVKFVAGRISVIVAAALFTLDAAVFQAINFDGHSELKVLFFGPPAALLVYGLLAWEVESGALKIPRLVIRCGDMSYSIYLVHLLVVHFAYRYIWQAFNHDGVRPLFMVAAAALALASSVVFYKLVEMPFSLWTRLRLEEIFRVPAKIAIARASVDPAV